METFWEVDVIENFLSKKIILLLYTRYLGSMARRSYFTDVCTDAFLLVRENP